MSNSKIVIPKKEITFSIGENEYVVKYPNNGSFIDIEAMKARLTGDAYNILTQGVTVSAQLARYTTDMIAFYSICCPKLKQDLKVDTFSSLEMLDSKKLLKVYVDVILPWLSDWEIILNSEDDISEKEE